MSKQIPTDGVLMDVAMIMRLEDLSGHTEEPCSNKTCTKQALWVPVFDQPCHRAGICMVHRAVVESYRDGKINCVQCGLKGLHLTGWERY